MDMLRVVDTHRVLGDASAFPDHVLHLPYRQQHRGSIRPSEALTLTWQL